MGKVHERRVMYSIASSENVHGGWKAESAWVLMNTSTYTRETRGPERESKLYALCYVQFVSPCHAIMITSA